MSQISYSGALFEFPSEIIRSQEYADTCKKVKQFLLASALADRPFLSVRMKSRWKPREGAK